MRRTHRDSKSASSKVHRDCFVSRKLLECVRVLARLSSFARLRRFRFHSELRREVITVGVRPGRYIDIP